MNLEQIVENENDSNDKIFQLMNEMGSMKHAWERKRIAFAVLVGMPEAKRPLARSMHGWEASIELGFKETRYVMD
jgi:hypothetical protein